MADDEDWENEVLSEKKEAGISKDAARKLLEINPGMREKGVDTNFIVKQSEQAKAGHALTKAPPQNRELGFDAAKDVDHLLELAGKQYAQEKREIESELSILQAKLNGMKGRYLRSMMNRLTELDRTLSSPMTHAALQQHKVIMNELGFTPHKFMEHLRQKR